MNPPPPEDPRVRIDALFEQALEYEGEARRQFLDRATAGDTGLRAELETLLRLADEPVPYLDALTGAPRWQAMADEPAPQTASDRRIGAWRLLRELGSGGMGAVYLAERAADDFTQSGALKLIRPAMDSPEFERRFAQERQILATLSHPGIARLLDGGRDADGRPYLVMEYVDGLPLDRYCDAHRLTIEQRLALFVQIVDAVAHAHRHLVVHRDLKPSNIVVTAEGAVKLLDFGIAKVLAETAGQEPSLTRTAVRLFTPEYAAPEQVLGQPAATAADVYQLGLLLYELLTGQRAQQIADGSAATLERMVCHADPPRPSIRAAAATSEVAAARHSSPAALRRKLRGDLDNIVLKALRKAPERRYATAAELVDDIKRWQQGRPVRARSESLGYRTGKFVLRHPFGVAGATMALLLLVAYAVTVTLQADAIARERDRARAEAAKAQQVKALVLRLFEGADPQQSGGAQLSARELLDRGWAGVETELIDQPEVRIELLDTVGEAYRQLGLYERAQPLFEQALQLAMPPAGKDPLRLAHALRSRARLHTDMGEYDKAEQRLQDALARYRQLLGGTNAEVADTISDLGMLRFRMSELAAAERDHRDALAMRRRLFDEEHPDVADSLDELGTVLRHQGDYAGAEPLLSQALALRRRLLPPTHPQLASNLSNLALTRVNLGEYDSADALYREAQALMIQSSGARHPLVARVMNNHALLMQARRDFPAAEQLLRQALSIRREALGEHHPEVAMNLNDLGLALSESGDADAAEVYYRQALVAYPPTHPWRSATVFNLGMLAEKRGDLTTAEQHYREALARQRQDYGDEHERVGIDLNRIGIVLHRQGRLDEAEAHFGQALAIFRKRLPDGHPRLALVLVPLGKLLLDRNRPTEARTLLQEAWQVRHTAFGDSDARTIEAAEALAAAGGTLAKQDG